MPSYLSGRDINPYSQLYANLNMYFELFKYNLHIYMYGSRRDELRDYPSGNIRRLFRKQCVENYMHEERFVSLRLYRDENG